MGNNKKCKGCWKCKGCLECKDCFWCKDCKFCVDCVWCYKCSLIKNKAGFVHNTLISEFKQKMAEEDFCWDPYGGLEEKEKTLEFLSQYKKLIENIKNKKSSNES